MTLHHWTKAISDSAQLHTAHIRMQFMQQFHWSCLAYTLYILDSGTSEETFQRWGDS